MYAYRCVHVCIATVVCDLVSALHTTLAMQALKRPISREKLKVLAILSSPELWYSLSIDVFY